MLKRLVLLMLMSISIWATEPTTENVTKLYIATFDRAPDKAGIEYWVELSNLNLEQIAQSFFDQPETKQKYPDGYTTENFVKAIYNNLFGRDPDKAGLDYWVKELDSGKISKPTFILAVVNGALADDKQLLDNKTVVGLICVKEDVKIETAKAIMKEVKADPATVSKVLEKFGLDKSKEEIKTSNEALKIEITRKDNWNTGFCANINIYNTSNKDIKWEADFDAKGVINNFWNANYTQDPNTLMTHISGLDWNRVVKAKEKVEVGYCADKVASKIPPANKAETNSEGLIVNQVTKNSWDSGYCNDVIITNTTNSDITWSVTIPADGDVYTLWNANYTQDPNTKEIQASGVDWNKIVEPNSEVTFGYCANTVTQTSNSTDNSANKDENNQNTNGDSEQDSSNSATDDSNQDSTKDNNQEPSNVTAPPTDEKTSNFTKDDYESVLKKSYLFYEAQRASGPFPHVSWRNPAALDDGKDVGRDLSKGWFDAGDHVKFNLPMSYSASVLELGMITFPDAYNQAGEMTNAKDQVKYVLDYLMNAYNEGSNIDDPSDDKIYYQVGDGDADHSFWGPPEDMTMNRPTYTCDKDNKCSEVGGDMAAALAAGSILFADDKEYSSKLLQKAKGVYTFASTYEGNNGYTAANPFYTSYSGYNDELAYAAAWLYKATGETKYLQDAQKYMEKKKNDVYWAMSWDNVSVLAAYLLYNTTDDSQYSDIVKNHLNAVMKQEKTDGGLTFFLQWGSLRYAANGAFVSLLYANTLPKNDSYRATLINYAQSQIDYILGDNPRKSSYVIGFGNNYPINPHHRAAHYSKEHNIDTPVNNTYLLEGALVGGPKSKDDFDYKDDRHDYICNEVATDYNAGFTGAIAGLIELK